MDAVFARRRPLAVVVMLLGLVSALLALTSSGAATAPSLTFYLVATGLGLIVVLVLAAAPVLLPNAAWLLPFLGGLLLAAGAGPGVVGTTPSRLTIGLAVLALMAFAVVALVRKVDMASDQPVSRL